MKKLVIVIIFCLPLLSSCMNQIITSSLNLSSNLVVTEESIVTQKGEIGLETFFLLDKINNQEFAYLNFTYEPWVLTTYSKNLDSLRSLKIEVPKDDYPIYFEMTDEKIYLIIGSEFSNFLTITGKIFNAKDGKQISETKMLKLKLYDMYQDEKFDIGNLKFILSPDESKFLLYYARYPEGKNYDAYEFYAFNRDFEQINNFTQEIDINKNDFFDFFIDNDGYIYSVIDYNLEEKRLISAQKVMHQNISTLTVDVPHKIQGDFFSLDLCSQKSIIDKNNSIITISNICNISNESEFIIACNFDFINNKVTTKNIFEESDTWVDSLDFSLEIEDFKIIDILTEKNNNKTVILQYESDYQIYNSNEYEHSIGNTKIISKKGIDRVDTYLKKGPIVVFFLDSNLNILNKNAIDKESKHGVSRIPVFGFEYYKAPRRIAYDFDVYSIYRNGHLNLFYLNNESDFFQGSVINRYLKDNKFSDEYLLLESEGMLNRAYALVRQTIWFGDNEMILPIFCVQGIENQQVFKLYSLQYKN